MTRAINASDRSSDASDRSSDARDRKLLAITSSLPEGSRRRLERSARARPTCTPRESLAIAPGVFDLTSRRCELRETDHGQLVADWVELFAPVVFESHRPAAWPAEGSLLLDHLPFRVRALDASGSGSQQAGSRLTCARSVTTPGSRVSGTPRLSLAPLRQTGARSLARCQANRNGSSVMPTAACCGRSRNAGPIRSFTNANGICSTLLSACSRRRRGTTQAMSSRNSGRAPRAPSLVPSSGALSSAQLGSLRTKASIAGSFVNGPTIEAQFARRVPASRRPADMPLTTAALEQITRPIVAALYPRRYALKNRERLNRLLMLLQLNVNGDDDVQRYANAIRTWLESNGGLLSVNVR